MADFAYNIAKKQLLDGLLDFDTGGDVFHIILLEANSDVNPDDIDVTTVLGRAGTTELATYSRGTVAGQGTTQDDANDRGEFDGNDQVFSAVVAQNDITGYLLIKFVTDDDGSFPIAFFDGATGLPLPPNGSDITITWNAEGILQTT